jgi:hypothetical protein
MSFLIKRKPNQRLSAGVKATRDTASERRRLAAEHPEGDLQGIKEQENLLEDRFSKLTYAVAPADLGQSSVDRQAAKQTIAEIFSDANFAVYSQEEAKELFESIIAGVEDPELQEQLRNDPESLRFVQDAIQRGQRQLIDAAIKAIEETGMKTDDPTVFADSVFRLVANEGIEQEVAQAYIEEYLQSDAHQQKVIERATESIVNKQVKEWYKDWMKMNDPEALVDKINEYYEEFIFGTPGPSKRALMDHLKKLIENQFEKDLDLPETSKEYVDALDKFINLRKKIPFGFSKEVSPELARRSEDKLRRLSKTFPELSIRLNQTFPELSHSHLLSKRESELIVYINGDDAPMEHFLKRLVLGAGMNSALKNCRTC